VRDLLLDRPPADLDIVTAAPPDAVAALFERTIPVGAEFNVMAVILGGHPYQVATFRREGPYLDGRRPSFVERADAAADVQRRDFTINALLYDPLTDEVLDLVGGRADLERRLLRTVGDPAVRFAEDRLRMLRAIRFAAELGFAIDPATLDAIPPLAAKIRTVSAERIHEELVRLLVAPERGAGIRLLTRTGLLDAVLPEVAALAGQPAVPSGAAEERLAQTIAALEGLRRPSAVVAMATLLHLLDAPEQVDAICRRLRFSTPERRAIAALVRDSSGVAEFAQMSPGTLKGLLRRSAPAELLELFRVRSLAAGADRAAYTRAAEIFAAHPGVRGLPRPLLTGSDLIALGHTPGPGFAQILDAVDAAHARGEIHTPEEARAWVRDRYAGGPAPRLAEASPWSGSRGPAGG
jgi:poly(A) polymerase